MVGTFSSSADLFRNSAVNIEFPPIQYGHVNNHEQCSAVNHDIRPYGIK